MIIILQQGSPALYLSRCHLNGYQTDNPGLIGDISNEAFNPAIAVFQYILDPLFSIVFYWVVVSRCVLSNIAPETTNSIRLFMKVKYLKYKQAVAACIQHQNLIGRPFDKDNEAAGTVKHVLIAPYSRILLWHYLSTVFNGADPNKAIAICRDGKYDVVVISSNYYPGEQDFPPKSLRNYLAEFSVETSEG